MEAPGRDSRVEPGLDIRLKESRMRRLERVIRLKESRIDRVGIDFVDIRYYCNIVLLQMEGFV